MSTRITLNENSSAALDVEIEGPDGLPANPPCTYRIDDAKSGAAIRAETPAQPVGGLLSIDIEPSDTIILDPLNRIEQRVVTITCNPGTTAQFIDEFVFSVRNMRFV